MTLKEIVMLRRKYCGLNCKLSLYNNANRTVKMYRKGIERMTAITCAGINNFALDEAVNYSIPLHSIF